MKEIYTEIEVNASSEEVWQVLTDFESYPEWNPFVTSAKGELKEGGRLKVRIEQPGGMAMTFKPTVVKTEPNKELRWLRHLMMPGLFDGEHIFTIEPADENKVRFVQREEFKGILVPLFGLMGIFKSSKRGFEALNKALKERAEKGEAFPLTADTKGTAQGEVP